MRILPRRRRGAGNALPTTRAQRQLPAQLRGAAGRGSRRRRGQTETVARCAGDDMWRHTDAVARHTSVRKPGAAREESRARPRGMPGRLQVLSPFSALSPLGSPGWLHLGIVQLLSRHWQSLVYKWKILQVQFLFYWDGASMM